VSHSSREGDEQYAALLEDLSPSSSSSAEQEQDPERGTTYWDPEAVEKSDAHRTVQEQKVKDRQEEVKRGKAWEEKVRVMRTWAGLGVLVMLVGFVMWR
jgi:hypothetical protein